MTFRIYAPEASEVRLRGDWMEGFGTEPLAKDEQGVRSATVGPLVPDFYSYSFVVDGVKTVGPKNAMIKQGTGTVHNMLMVPEVAAALAAVQARFTSEPMHDVVPFVEKTYRVRSEPRSRAIAGLSMGGGQTQRLLAAHPDAFAYVAIWSAGVRPEGSEAFEKGAAAFLADPAKTNRPIRLLSIRVGDKHFTLAGCCNLDELLARHKIEHTLQVNGGGHTWINWRLYLRELLPQLFR